MSDKADELSRQASEFARRAMEIQAGHLADVRRRTSIWTVLSQPRFDGEPDIAEPDEDEFKKPKSKKKKGKKAKKTKAAKSAKKAKKKDRK